MTTEHRRVAKHMEQLLEQYTLSELARQLEPKYGPLPPGISGGTNTDSESVEKRWNLVNISEESKSALVEPSPGIPAETYQHNIEYFIGTVKLPVGLIGPLRVNGTCAQGDYYVPLATTEAALVASYNRGAKVISKAGGCTALLLMEGISRAPGFAFTNIAEAGMFVSWAVTQLDDFRRVAEETTRHGKLVDIRIAMEGNHVYLIFDYTTGDASGQNMVTIATEAVCQYIIAQCPTTPQYHFIEANLSGDKKASAQSFLSVRGKKVTAEATISADLVERILHTTPERMVDYWRMSAIGGVLSGTIGVQGHFANGLAALYIACGQDAACVSESAVGITRFEITADRSLYVTVTLPNLVVGTVGGGTNLPSQKACLEIMGLSGEGHARSLAEVCAATLLAGEISIIGALTAGDFAKAHQRLARGKALHPNND